MPIEIRVPGQPQGKGRARFARQGRFVRAYTPTKTVAYEGLIALAAEQVVGNRGQISGPVDLRIAAVFQIPKSWSKKRRLEASLAPEWHTGKPDSDNIMKAVGDGLNGIVWKDDSQIARCSLSKVYGETPGLLVTVTPL
jgi:Holliday junction resolvase RusA-like endonuclease